MAIPARIPDDARPPPKKSARQDVVRWRADPAALDQEQGSGVDWEHPGVGAWNAPSFLTTAAGDSFKYSCAYENTSSTPVTVGETAASNEMCMAVTYWFPASLGAASCR